MRGGEALQERNIYISLKRHNSIAPVMVRSVDNARLVNLKVVARIKRGQKLNTRMHYFQIVEKSILNSMSIFRWLNGESREQTIASLTELVNSCINTDVLKPDDIPIMVEEVVKTSGGLCNLIYTYIEDSTVESSLTLIIEQIGRFVEKHGTTKDKQEFQRRCSLLNNEGNDLINQEEQRNAVELDEEEVEAGS